MHVLADNVKTRAFGRKVTPRRGSNGTTRQAK